MTLPYSTDLGCGACIRSGFISCHRSQVTGQRTHCCSDYACAATFVSSNPGSKCSQDFDDRLAMLHTFCKISQTIQHCGGRDEFEIKKKEWTNVTMNLTNMTYGDSCSYRVRSKCGYPKIQVNNSNVDMIVSYKKD